jgi:CubicO group peptidase (beta-lactamase class C family)
VPRPAVLHGLATDDGAPQSLVVTWSVVSGPGTVTFLNAHAADTTATFATAGTYELQLSATDSQFTANDFVIVNVAPAVYPAADLSDADPDRGWLRAVPGELGMDPGPLAEAQAYAQQAGGTGLISRYGRIVYSWGNIDQRFDVKSTTKSIGAIALALALDDNLVRIDERAATYVPSFGLDPPANDPVQAQSITLLQLATHTAGFEKTARYGRLLDPPGTAWRYSDGGLNWLADTLTTVYRQDLEELFKTRVYPVLGINERDDIQWRDMSDGFRPLPRPLNVEHREFAAGMIANVNALARVGLLYLRRGEWTSGQRVFSASFADLARTPRTETANTQLREPADYPDANHRYGVLWWTNATGALPNVPRDAYWAWGLGDSLIVVIPSLDLVIARAGPSQGATPNRRVFGDDDWNADYAVLAPFLDPIVRAVTQ